MSLSALIFPPATDFGRSFTMPTGYTVQMAARLRGDRWGFDISEVPLDEIVEFPRNQRGVLLVQVFDMSGGNCRVIGQCVMIRDRISMGISGVWVDPSHHGHDLDALMSDLAMSLFGSGRNGFGPRTYRFTGSTVTLIEQEPSRLVKPGDFL